MLREWRWQGVVGRPGTAARAARMAKAQASSHDRHGKTLPPWCRLLLAACPLLPAPVAARPALALGDCTVSGKLLVLVRDCTREQASSRFDSGARSTASSALVLQDDVQRRLGLDHDVNRRRDEPDACVHACVCAWCMVPECALPELTLWWCAVEAKSSLLSQMWSFDARKEREASRPKTSVRFVASKGAAVAVRSIDRAQDHLASQARQIQGRAGYTVRQTAASTPGPQVVASLEFARAKDQGARQVAAASRNLPAGDSDLFVNTLGDPRKFTSDYEFELQMLLDRQVGGGRCLKRDAGAPRCPPRDAHASLDAHGELGREPDGQVLALHVTHVCEQEALPSEKAMKRLRAISTSLSMQSTGPTHLSRTTPAASEHLAPRQAAKDSLNIFGLEHAAGAPASRVVVRVATPGKALPPSTYAVQP